MNFLHDIVTLEISMRGVSMREIICNARNGKKILVDECNPNENHPNCHICKSPNKEVDKEVVGLPTFSNQSYLKPNYEKLNQQKPIISEALEILLDGKYPFDRVEYPAILSLSYELRRNNLNYRYSTLRRVLEDKASEYYFDEPMPTDRLEKSISTFQKMIDRDIKILDQTVNILSEEVEKRKKESEKKYKQIAKWIVDDWGCVSKFVLGENWQEFKIKGGRPSSFDVDKIIRVMTTNTLKSQGFEFGGTGNYYQHYKPKTLVKLANAAFMILHRNKVIKTICEELSSSKEGLKKVLPAYFNLINLIYEQGPVSLFHWDDVAYKERKELLRQVEVNIQSHLYKNPS